MRKTSIHLSNSDLIYACQHLAEVAEALVCQVPQQKSIELERLALFDAIFHAQLVLSVARLPLRQGKQQQEAKDLKNQLQRSQDKSRKSQHGPEQLDWLIHPVSLASDEPQPKAIGVQALMSSAVRPPAPVLPFRRFQ